VYNLSLSVFLAKISEFRYRDRISIVCDILDTLRRTPKGKTKTSIMRSANLNYRQANRYIDMLLLCDLIRGVPSRSIREECRYKLTQKGSQVATELDTLYITLRALYSQVR